MVLLTSGADDGEPDPATAPLRIASVRDFRHGYLVSFEGVRDRNDAERLRGRYLYVELEELAPLEEGEVFYHQLLGIEVVTTDGKSLGRVKEVYELRPADLLEVQGPHGDVMIPFLSHIVVEVDAAAGRLVVDPPEGLLDLSAP